MNHSPAFLTSLICLLLAACGARAAGPSAENYVYQFMSTQTYTVPKFETPPGINVGFLFFPHTSTGYLWVPPACKRIRGVVVLGDNVPEQWMGGHPAIRAACAEQGLAILYTCGSFRLSAVNHVDNRVMSPPEKARHNIAFLQHLLDALATESGYEELRTVPWLPIGESMSLQIVNQLTQFAAQRCIAGVWVKDGFWSCATSGVPMLAACGTGAEWDFPKYDAFERWREMAVTDMKECVAKRTTLPDWPGSLVVEAGSAHFSCTEAMIQLIARYIRAACGARLAADGSPTLRPVDLASGYVAGIPVPGSSPVKPMRYTDCTPEQRHLPWYFDLQSAQDAFDMANVNWSAKTQVPAFTDEDGKPIPYSKPGIADFSPTMEADGVTFALHAAFLDKLPDGCVKAQTPLGHAPGNPAVTWLRGPVVPLGGNRFRLALDRTADLRAGHEQNPLFLVSHPGNEEYRLSVNPASVHIPFNKGGKPQTITFDAIPDLKPEVKEIELKASADSGLPVRFYVKAGPATVEGNQLRIAEIPARTKQPIKVTVVAWQWGRAAEPAIQSAPVVERTFQILLAQ
jgi:hypothetical protein